MRKTIIPAIVLLAWSISLPAIAAPPSGTTTPEDAMAGAINSIAQATDPSAAVSAFSAVPEPARSNPRVISAYVQRMVGFGVPEIAFHQAQSLIAADPNNGVGWAVVGFVNAKKGSMSEALAAISKAAACQPDDTFVQAAAGQLVAWFDANPMAMTEPIRQSLDSLRKALGTRAGFITAYNQAKGELTPPPQASTSSTVQSEAPAAGQPDYSTLMASPAYQQAPPTGYVVPDSGYGGYYPDYSSYGLYGWWSPSPFFAGSFFSPNAVIISPFFFGFNHHHHHAFGSGFNRNFFAGGTTGRSAGMLSGRAAATVTPSVASGGRTVGTLRSGTIASPAISTGSVTHASHSGSSAGVMHAAPSFSSGSGFHTASTPHFSSPHFSAPSSGGGFRGGSGGRGGHR